MTGQSAIRRRVLMLGATGTIGQATVCELVARGHDVVCFIRPGAKTIGEAGTAPGWRAHVDVRYGDVTDKASLLDGLRGERFDVLMSCLASRTGHPDDAWKVDHDAHILALHAARAAGVSHFVLLSAICVQKPRLAFQFAKLKFEETLIRSGMAYSIVRPTAYFKSLSGQIERVRKGKPFLVFGDGTSTACKPISDRDLGRYLADCLQDPNLRNRILPIGGPGDAITPRQQAAHLFEVLGRPPLIRQAPVALLQTIVLALTAAGRLSPLALRKAELARIGLYYATESMLVFDHGSGRYDASATPSTGADTLFQYYEDVVAGRTSVERGDHAVFT